MLGTTPAVPLIWHLEIILDSRYQECHHQKMSALCLMVNKKYITVIYNVHVGSVFTLSHPVLGVPGGNVSLQCNFTGYLPLNYEIQWTDESGMIIDSDYSSTVVSNEAGISQSGRSTTEGGVVSTLTFLSVDFAEDGEYTCVMLGTELKGTVSLLILGKHNNKNIMCISANCVLGCILQLCVLSLGVPFIDIVTTTVIPSTSITIFTGAPTAISSSTTPLIATSSVPSVIEPASSLALTLIIALLPSFIGGIMCVLLIVIPIIILLACKARKNRGVNDEQKDNAFEFGINTTYGRGGGGERNLILGLNRAYDVKGEVETEAVYEELDTVEYEELPEVTPLHEELPHPVLKSDINAQAADPIAVNNDDGDTADGTADTTGYEEMQPAATVLIAVSNEGGTQEVPEDEHDYY